MRSRELKKVLAQVAKLTWPQRQELIQALSEVDEMVQVEQGVGACQDSCRLSHAALA